jgi:archaellum component FlaC
MVSVKTDINSLKKQVNNNGNNLNHLNKKIDKMKTREEAIFEQTAILTEFRTEVNYKLNKLDDSFEFIKHKTTDNEKEIYEIKKRIRENNYKVSE